MNKIASAILTDSFLLGSLTGSISTDILSPCFVAPVTFVSSLNFKPCFVRILWKFFATSKSMPTPPIFDKNSTATTFAPNRLHTDPYKPIVSSNYLFFKRKHNKFRCNSSSHISN